MHHPLSWLVGWARVEVEKVLRNNFSLSLSGHLHDQSAFHSIVKGSHLIQCSAPPLMTKKKERLGYALFSVGPGGVHEIQYRQWTATSQLCVWSRLFEHG